MKELNNKQKKFVIEYLKDQNATQAAMRAGYSKHTANEQGAQLLAKLSVKAEIDKLMGCAAESALVTREYIVNGLKEVAERCLQRVPVMKFDYEEKRLVQEMAIEKDLVTGETKEVGIWEFDSAGANKAFQLLGQTLDIFKGDGKGEAKITVEIKQVP